MHFDVVVGAGEVNGTPEPPCTKEGPTFQMEPLHLEFLRFQMLVEVPTVEYESLLASPVVGSHTQGHNTLERGYISPFPGALGFTLSDGFRYEVSFAESGLVIRLVYLWSGA